MSKPLSLTTMQISLPDHAVDLIVSAGCDMLLEVQINHKSYNQPFAVSQYKGYVVQLEDRLMLNCFRYA